MLIASILMIIGFVALPVITLIGWVISGVGFLLIYDDRIYYPKPHQDNMRYSLMLYLSGIPIFIIGAVSTIFYFLLTSDSESSINNFIYPNILFGTIVLTIIGSALMFMGRYKLLVELIPPEKKYMLRFAVIFVLIAILIIIILLIAIINTENFIFILLLIPAIYGLAIISHLLFLYCLYIAYDFQKRTPRPYSRQPIPPKISFTYSYPQTPPPYYYSPPPVYYPPPVYQPPPRPYYYYPYYSYYHHYRPPYYYYY